MTGRPLAPTVKKQTVAASAWQGLNKRQQEYLAAIYRADQDREADIAARRRDMHTVPAADVWRWLPYFLWIAPKLPGDPDPGTGSTMSALRRRGLVLVKEGYLEGYLGPVLQVRLTTEGRAAARAGLGIAPKKSPPTGLLSQWLWDALAVLYRAGGTGCLYNTGAWGLPRDHPERGPSWNALLQLRGRQDGPYMEEFRSPTTDRMGDNYRVRITDRGRAHAELHFRCYAELYPEVAGIVPEVPLEEAHEGLAWHSRPRPRHLVSGPDWRLLATLARAELKRRCPYRDRQIADFQRARVPVPEAVLAIPDGLTRYAADRAGSKASVERLTKPRGGTPLVETITVTNTDRWDTAPTVELVCLTEAGRAHVAEYRDEYRRFYPEIVDELDDNGPSPEPW